MNTTNTLTKKQRIEIYEGNSCFIKNIDGDYFITLHFSSTITKDQASKALKNFLKNMNREIFGGRSQKTWKQVSAIELNFDRTSYHIHIICEEPKPRIENPRRKRQFNLKSLIKSQWMSCSSKTTIRELSLVDDSPEWFKKIYDIDGVSRYISKQILSGHLDVIEWDQANFSGRRPAA